MARFAGKVGFGESAETAPGVWKDVITERTYKGTLIRPSRSLRFGETVSPELSVSNSISIVADDYARSHILAIRYAEWEGVRWTVVDVDVERPRLILRLGEVYRGDTP